VTFSAAHGARKWSWIRLKSGSQSGEERLTIAVVDSTTVQIEAPFSAAQSGAWWACRRCIKDVFVCNSLLYLTNSESEFGQIDPGVIHMTFANVTLPGFWPSDGRCIGFTQLQNGYFFRSVRAFDSIFKNFNSSTTNGAAAFPSSGQWDGDNNWYCTGTNRDTGGTADGDFWTVRGQAYSDGYLAPAAMTRTHAGKTVMVPYDMNGAARSSSSKIGAVAQ
jgi:hypothetical protein